ncbi:phosphoribosylaminoimidazole carboxylase (NCAIR synthetase) [Chitinophaga terrae (ex Kim and Jung 2007)]|uniref:hypothetical protein n=1 Tax=Chitinophaga terrae (ex Kim and Jung 2007) TaxID=408074 RepID=UPI002784D878|nr:hypothetical protein [Chitinophaga terrae (ex Kim and Jung 2007)]MDQ0110462.1 phosphoribosylaminoimidazole carboxylase (NCAIR synthetase) [Chitinophaga terrae (ex Kim and Jung 2007)]
MNVDKDNYLSSVIEKLKMAQNNEQVESIISTAVNGIKHAGYTGMQKTFISQLQLWIEELSPLDWNSTQWACFRYALIYSRKYSANELVQG